MMLHHPRRTNATSLTDDELTLLDVMFDAGVPLRLLRRKTFADQWNLKPHGLDDVALVSTVTKLRTDGILFADPSDPEHHQYLTTAGGLEWQLERRPAWDRFVCDRYGEHCSGKPTITLVAASPEIRDQFWTAGVACGMFAYTQGRRKTQTIHNYSMLPWRPPSTAFVTVAVLDNWWCDTDWVKLEAQRNWWRSPLENDRFWG